MHDSLEHLRVDAGAPSAVRAVPGPGAALLWCGWLVPTLFWLTLVGCGLARPGYDQVGGLVSELGRLGTPTRSWFTAGLVTCAALSAGFIGAVWTQCRASGLSVAPVAILLSFTVSVTGAGLFPLPLRLHLVAGLPSVLLILSPLAALILWRKGRASAGVAPFAVTGLVLMAAGFLAFLPGVLPGHPGVIQRVFHLGWSVWFVGLWRTFSSAAGRKGDAVAA